MAAPQQKNSNVRLLTCPLDDEDTGDSDYRFLVDGRHVEYVSTATGTLCVFDVADRPFGNDLTWRVSSSFPHFPFEIGTTAMKPESRRITRLPHINGFATQAPVSNNKFLGHLILTEGTNGRIIGFIVEWLGGSRSAEPRNPGDCKKVLARLHQLGIKHGDINKHNFPDGPVQDGQVVLADFEAARRDFSHVELEDEMNALKDSLESTDARGGGIGAV
ncbi:hypothetical protein E4U58_007630 [Claviceps cyperi]|nr:hypothetical protein E4U58_007630 [Claviceps cyperi]